jgi:hypothetical protein
VTIKVPEARCALRRKTAVAITASSYLIGGSRTLLLQLAVEPIPQVGGQLGQNHPRFDESLAPSRTPGIGVIRGLHGHLAVAAFVVPAESAENHSFVHEELDAAEERIVLGNGEGATLDLNADQLVEGVVERIVA